MEKVKSNRSKKAKSKREEKKERYILLLMILLFAKKLWCSDAYEMYCAKKKEDKESPTIAGGAATGADNVLSTATAISAASAILDGKVNKDKDTGVVWQTNRPLSCI